MFPGQQNKNISSVNWSTCRICIVSCWKLVFACSLIKFARIVFKLWCILSCVDVKLLTYLWLNFMLSVILLYAYGFSCLPLNFGCSKWCSLGILSWQPLLVSWIMKRLGERMLVVKCWVSSTRLAFCLRFAPMKFEIHQFWWTMC